MLKQDPSRLHLRLASDLDLNDMMLPLCKWAAKRIVDGDVICRYENRTGQFKSLTNFLEGLSIPWLICIQMEILSIFIEKLQRSKKELVSTTDRLSRPTQFWNTLSKP